MSLLSDTQGRPHIVRAIVQTMKNLGGSLPDDELIRWFLPGVFLTERRDKDEKPEGLVRQALGCARSLGWVDSDRKSHRLTNLEIPTDPEAFLDYLHVALCTTDKVEDRRILEAYSVLVLQTEASGTSQWLKDWTTKKLADFIDSALRAGATSGDRVFNTTKLAAWFEWLAAVGLGWNSDTLGFFLPDPVVRLRRELPYIADIIGGDVELPPFDFLREVGKRMPYLDGGSIFEDVSGRMKARLPTDQVSLVLARTLHELQEEKLLTLASRGDAVTCGLRMPRIGEWDSQVVVGITLHEEGRS